MSHLKQIKLSLIVLLACFAVSASASKENFNKSWKFHLVEESVNNNESYEAMTLDDSAWEDVTLPHNAHNEPLLVNDQWQGISWYRKTFDVPNYSNSLKYVIEFEAAMNHTTIWVNEQQVKVYQGGYLPIVFDATPYLKESGNVIAVRLDNRDNEVTGPKPLKILDFNMYGGLYRNAWFITKEQAHITHPILANRAASGGVFVSYPSVSEEVSTVRIQTHVANESTQERELQIAYKITKGDEVVEQVVLAAQQLAPAATTEFVEVVSLTNPALWSPQSPNLYQVEVSLLEGDKLLDSETTRFGIRNFTFKDNQLYINGKKTYLRGVNRHQEYPYIGYALSDNAQYRDAKKIKEAGFDYIRLSHYPQSPAFMDACDELGLVVADAILGWQYYNETYVFKNQSYNSVRDLIRRDRNHACVMMWEVSLNETAMPVPFMKELHRIAHEEYPGEATYTCGWLPDVYDIYFQARQHRIGHPEQITFVKPYMVSEYGDWEYYAGDAGLNQHNLTPEKRVELSSRQLRESGEVGLLQQAYNVQEAHNDNMNIPATGDSYWVMFDYNRGYHDEIESSGIMDIFRLPKFGYYFYQSQRPATEREGAMIKIASYWMPNSNKEVKVYSNCEEVKLYLNNKLVATQKPDTDVNSTNINCPPFTFKLATYKKGELRAEGYIAGKKVVTDRVKSAQKARKLSCWVDTSDKAAQAGCNDVLFVYIAAVDKNGTICTDYTEDIQIELGENLTLLNVGGIKTEAGIATALVKVGDNAGNYQVNATSTTGLKGKVTLQVVE